MKLCVFGAGAIGGLIGGRLAAAGMDPLLVARGAQLAALRDGGLRLESAAGAAAVPVRATDRPDLEEVQGVVFVCLKAHGLPAAAEGIAALCGPDTALVMVLNGIPWWYFHRLGGPHHGHRIEMLDPGGRIARALDPARVIGCVAHAAAHVEAPGHVVSVGNERFILGEPDGSDSPRLRAACKAMADAGMQPEPGARIRDDIWLKLSGNAALNPISVLTGATMVEMCRDPDMRALVERIMGECRAVGQALGARFAVDVPTRIGWADSLGMFRPSTLQDYEAGRPLEIDPLVGVVPELGRLCGISTPVTETVYSMVKSKAELKGLYPRPGL
ncbi:MAG: 2-dehydropantoate 2-reductase [Acetobacterales bacterium]